MNPNNWNKNISGPIAKKIIVNLTVWLLTFVVVMVVFTVTVPPDASPKYGIDIPIASTFLLVILGVFVQGEFIVQRYFEARIPRVISVFIVGTLIFVLMYLPITFGGDYDFRLLMKWLFVPCYSATLISYCLTEIWLKS